MARTLQKEALVVYACAHTQSWYDKKKEDTKEQLLQIDTIFFFFAATIPT